MIARSRCLHSMATKTRVSATHATSVATTSPEAHGLVTPPHSIARAKEINEERIVTAPGMSRARAISVQLALIGLALDGVW